MKKFRAILTGALVWVFIFISFTILSTIPTIKDSMNLQALIVAVLIIPFAIFGASVYYKNGNNDNGFVLGIKMVITALILDALITVPFVVIPTGGSYLSFYTFPLLWLLVAVNMATVYLYWKLKVKV
jgi:archaellum biogenesis protein FlaJ (TadC family)